MSEEVSNKIKQYIAEHRQEIDQILAPANLPPEEVNRFLGVISIGGFELSDLANFFLVNNEEMTVEDSIRIQGELFDKVFIEIDDELEQQREEFLKRTSQALEDIEMEELLADPSSIKLSGIYNNFLELPEVADVGKVISAAQPGDFQEIKDKFYDAINNKNRLEFMQNLAIMFSSGRTKDLFRGDERYVKFWRNRILKDKGLDGVRKFDENPLRREQFGSFIRHVMVERFEIPASDAVLWGVLFSSLAHKAGDKDYEKLAYGDLNDQQFKWNL